MTQLRRTKPIFLILAGICLVVMMVLLILLVVNLYNDSADYMRTTEAENDKYISADTNEALTTEDIVQLYGFYFDEQGKIFDKNGIQYVRYDDTIRVIHESIFYSVPIEDIKKQQSTDSSLWLLD